MREQGVKVRGDGARSAGQGLEAEELWKAKPPELLRTTANQQAYFCGHRAWFGGTGGAVRLELSAWRIPPWGWSRRWKARSSQAPPKHTRD